MRYNSVTFLLPDPLVGGAERVTVTIARLLRKESFDVESVILGPNKGETSTRIESESNMICLRFSRVLDSVPKLCSLIKEHNHSIFFSSREHVSIVGFLVARLTN